jgi:hypothetical protein
MKSGDMAFVVISQGAFGGVGFAIGVGLERHETSAVGQLFGHPPEVFPGVLVFTQARAVADVNVITGDGFRHGVRL